MLKRKNMKRLLLILLALLLVYFMTSQYMSWKENQEQETEKENLSVTNIDEDAILSITYTDGQTTMGFELNDDTWLYDDDDTFPLRQSYMSELVGEIKQLIAERTIDELEPASEYGLEDPTYTVAITDAEGAVTTVKYGKLTANYNYYVTADGGESVFEIDSTLLDLLIFDEDDLLDHDVFPSISSSNLKSLTVEQGDDTLVECKAANDDEDEDADDELSAYGADLSAIYLEDCVDYNIKEKELSAYGLDEDSRKFVTAVYTDSDTEEEKNVNFYMSESVTENDENYIYIQMKGSQFVYRVIVTEMELFV